MSWKATAYVKELVRCPDGAELSAGQKLLLFVIADTHNTVKNVAWPGLKSLAEDSLCSIRQAQRHIQYMVEHRVIRQLIPENQGRGKTCLYQFCELDKPVDQRVQKDAILTPFKQDESAAKRVSEGRHPEHKRVTEGCHGGSCNKEEPVNRLKTEPVKTSIAFDPIEEKILEAYPKEGRVAKRAACKEIRLALGRIQDGETRAGRIELEAAAGYLLTRVKLYSASRIGRQDRRLGEFLAQVPHARTWFHQTRYLDDATTWDGMQYPAQRSQKLLTNLIELYPAAEEESR